MYKKSNRLSCQLLMLLSIVVSVQACTYGRTIYVETEITGKVTKGRVLNTENDLPIENVIVIALWIKRYPAFEGYRDVCIHIESTKTDEYGNWQINRESWASVSPLYDSDRTATFTEFWIYKPGFVFPSIYLDMSPRKGSIFAKGFPRTYSVFMYDSDKWVEVDSLDTAKRFVGFGNSYLKPSLKPSKGDMGKIRAMVNSSYCRAEDESERKLLEFYKAIREEYSVHAATEEDVKFLEKLNWYIEVLSRQDRNE